MRSRVSWGVLLALVVLLLATVSCETSDQKRASVAPPMRAVAPTLTAPATQPEPPKIQDKPLTPQADPVEAVIAKVEKEYQTGQANYAAGHLEAARENFDRAFNLLLEANLDIRADDRLQREFDKLIDGTHDLELQALKQGDGFTEQKSEPAPIEEANDVTFPVDPNIKAKAEAELKQTHSDLPLVMNDAVASYINYFSSRGKGTVERALTRAGRYREMISGILKQEGVPQDLIYLAQAESGFEPFALSRAGARGMWQFMASRASGYGLERNWWLDERQDPEKSTRAAARHLKDLHNQFGDWYLAMAAYNSGPGNVQHAVQRTGYADFWQLYRRGVLPKETRNYVPIIVAVTIMAKNPSQYGLEEVRPDPPLQADRVTISYPVDLRLVAECVDTSVTTLQELNPSLLRLTTPRDRTFDLALPAGTKQKYETAIAAIPQDMRVWWRYHKVQSGDSLAAIARKYRTTSRAIVEANSLDGQELQAESKLIIPVTPGTRAEGDGLAFSKRVTRYKVRRGDTVLSVADDFSVPVESLRKWNRLKGNQLRPGRVLIVHRPLASGGATQVAKSHSKSSLQAKSKAGRRTHRVKKGETLSSIANDYNTTVDALRRDNRKVAANLHPGDVLVIPAR